MTDELNAREQNARSFLLGVLIGSFGGLVLGSVVTALSADRLTAASEGLLRRLVRRRHEFRFDLMVQ